MATSKKGFAGRLRPPLTGLEMQFCQHYAMTGNQADACRMTWPEEKHPTERSSRLMKRAEVKAHIHAILDKLEAKAAERAAEALTLTLTQADARLKELIETRRLNRGEMLTQMTGEVHDAGITREVVEGSRGGKKLVKTFSDDFNASLTGGKPVEDADLLKGIDVIYKRLGAYPQAKQEQPGAVTVFLYQPAWKQEQKERTAPLQLEAGEID